MLEAAEDQVVVRPVVAEVRVRISVKIAARGLVMACVTMAALGLVIAYVIMEWTVMIVVHGQTQMPVQVVVGRVQVVVDPVLALDCVRIHVSGLVMACVTMVVRGHLIVCVITEQIAQIVGLARHPVQVSYL